jgi:outer membrane protein with beta-barrel domain
MLKLKRTSFFLLFSFIIVNAGFAQYSDYDQSSTFGLKLGTIYSKIILDDDAAQVIEGDHEFGLQIGAFYRFQINHIYIQPELDMTTISNKIVLLDFRGTANYPATGEDEHLDLKFRSWDIPIMTGGKWGNFRFDVGPVISILSKATGEFMEDELDVKDQFRKTSIAFRTGVGFDFGNLALDFKYERSLSKIGESIYILVGEEYVLKNRRFNLSASYLFKKKSIR